MRVLFIFVDGVGLGAEQPDNPFAFTETPGISNLLDGKRLTVKAINNHGYDATLVGLDAALGIAGLPQSATGQASIFTGINAAAFLGSHLNGFPNNALRKLLSQKGIFKQLKRKGFRVTFANAYRPPFFELLRRGLPGNRYSCSTLITYYGSLPFYSLEDLKNGKALYMDITNDILNKMNFNLPLITPEEGAERLLKISRKFDFSLFEYFLSDLAGHLGDRVEAGRVVKILDRFVGRLAEQINPEQEIIILTSDHGNLEDVSCRDHTSNQVPALIVGDSELRSSLFPGLENLTDLLPAVQLALDWNRPNLAVGRN